MESVNINEIVNWLVDLYGPVVVAIVVRQLFVWLRVLTPHITALINAHVSVKHQAVVRQIVREGVYAAEQIARREDVKNAGRAKRDAASAYINEKLGRVGLTLPLDEIYGMIEAEVGDSFNHYRDDEPQAPVALPSEQPQPTSKDVVSASCACGGACASQA